MNNSYGSPTTSDWLWEIIAQAENSRKNLTAILLEFDYDLLNRFEYEYKRAADYLTDDRFVEHMGNMGKSEDNIKDVTQYIVGKGKAYYMDVWNHPERMPALPEYNDSNLSYVTWEVLNEKFDDFLDDFGELPDERE